jgi:hypothetical protein
MKTIVLAALLFNPFAAIRSVIHRAFYATTNFFVDHIQPNQKGEHGKVVVPSNTTDVKSNSEGESK